MAALEGQMVLKNQSLNSVLSVQEIIECVKTIRGQILGCNGGWETYAYTHAQTNKGVTAVENDPYVATTSGRTCNTATTRAPGSAVVLKDSKNYVAIAANEVAIKEAVYAFGPLSVAFYVSSDFYFYKSGVYTDAKRKCGLRAPNHAVLLVGYGTENGTDYWLLKNSWGEFLRFILRMEISEFFLFSGTLWGDSGYFKMKRGVNLCNIKSAASYPKI